MLEGNPQSVSLSRAWFSCCTLWDAASLAVPSLFQRSRNNSGSCLFSPNLPFRETPGGDFKVCVQIKGYLNTCTGALPAPAWGNILGISSEGYDFCTHHLPVSGCSWENGTLTVLQGILGFWHGVVQIEKNYIIVWVPLSSLVASFWFSLKLQVQRSRGTATQWEMFWTHSCGVGVWKSWWTR